MLDEAGHLAELNDRQRAAATFGADSEGAGPLLVIAGAGSGKTRTLAHRVAHLIAEGTDPSRILLMTFSRRAAQELIRRVEALLSTSGKPWPAGALAWSGTFHAVGARMLRENAPALGLDPAFAIHDREDSADLMNLARHELGLSSTERRFPAKATCLAIYSRCVNAGAPLADTLRDAFPWCGPWETELRRLFAAYVASKQAQNVLDYDDLLLAWAQAMEEPAFARWIGGLWDHVLIDEYQDTNRLQARILLALKPDGRGVTAVGDDAQSIYGFRAATVRNILDFPTAFATPATVFTLDRNYRSSGAILAAANAVISQASERFAKELWTDRAAGPLPRLVAVPDTLAEARCVADSILEAREAGTPLSEQAVLFRTSSHSASLEVELTRRDVPFVKFGGLKFLSSAHVKDLLAALRFRLNPRDRVSGFRTLQLLSGVGPTAAGHVLDALAEAPAPAEALRAIAPPPRARADWPSLVELMTAQAGWPELLDLALAWYLPRLERLYEDAEARRADVLQLERIAAGYPDLERFLTDLTLDPPDAASDEAGVPRRDDEYLTLSTIHSAKGREWRSVFILNVVDGCIPSDLGTGTTEEIEEERRLLYVAMTRAKDELMLTTPLRFHVTGQARFGDRHVHALRSRFIPDEILDRFEQAAWPDGAAPGAGVYPAAPNIDLKSRMRDMWK